MAEKCEELIRKIGELSERMSLARGRILQLLERLYGREGMRELFGVRVELWEAINQLYRDIERGFIELRDTNACVKGTRVCIPLMELLKALDDYYEAMGERMKLMRKLPVCEE